MKTLRERTKIQQAFLDGDEIEVNYGGCDDVWDPYTDKHPDFNWMNNDFRIKPEPMEIWVNIFNSGGQKYFVHESEESAIQGAGKTARTVKFIEVIE